jgi:stress response protein SCP2
MVRFDLSGGSAFSTYRSVVFAELVREGDSWRFQAIGDPKVTDTFIQIVRDSYL